jgi:ribonuclease E
MESRKNNAAVERRMKDALKNDRARIQVGSISHFGLMEMSRQRLRPSLAEASLVLCPHCAGMGHVRSPESAALHILRAIEDEGAKFRAAEIGVVLPPEIALYLFNHKRDRLAAIEARYAMRVVFNADAAMGAANFRIEKIKAQTAVSAPAAASYGGAGSRAEPVSAVAEDEPEMADEEEEMAAAAPAEAPRPHRPARGGAPAADASDVGPPGETAEEGEKRRRRRRRRGKRREPGEGADTQAGAAESGATEAPVVAADDGAAAGWVPEATSELDAVLAAQLNAAEGEETEPARRRRARGGRRRRGGAEEAAAEPVTVYPDVAALFEAAEQAEAQRARPVMTEAPAALESVAALTVSTEAEAEAATEEPGIPAAQPDDEITPAKPDDEITPAKPDDEITPAKPAWAPKIIGDDAPVAERKRGWWRR